MFRKIFILYVFVIILHNKYVKKYYNKQCFKKDKNNTRND